MGLTYYKFLLDAAIRDMALCSGGFSRRVLVAWTNHFYKFQWSELESCLMEEDLPAFRECRAFFQDYISQEMAKSHSYIKAATRNAPNPLSDENIWKHVNAEIVIRALSGRRAKGVVQSIIRLQSAVSDTAKQREM